MDGLREEDSYEAALDEVARRFAIAITPAMQDLIDPADHADPIALQFRADTRELDDSDTDLSDPIGDKDDGSGIQLGIGAGGEAVHMDQFFTTCPWTFVSRRSRPL